MHAIYLLVVDKAWAKLYKAAGPQAPMTLVYHQALFGGRADPGSADEELARSLCRLLRADRLGGKYERLVMLASDAMLAALQRQYDGEWNAVLPCRLDELPRRYSDADLEAWFHDCMLHELKLREAAEAGARR